ncbi:MAG TPA: pitrilysin family protein [Chitinophagales bacterium]|nr:insulinase family protein [Chitinophagales bacterium]HMX03648.1 pitrilysin family protein [Chitinophagales bacterium]HMZ87947.1 pitrilysin family protein [Chitinophagales bacterium]HNA57575.1 pitrilysin family protein [Chitinophagales bacterium]HNE44754.1 pitrilysin family protein [Chitinophagales bacterium]
MRKRMMISMCLLLLAGIMHAQSPLPSNFFLKTLPNGLQMLVIEDPTVPLATIEIVVKNGSYTEDSTFNGLSHMYEHMFFKANKSLPSQEAFLEKVQELGVVFNGTTSNERVNYFITLSNAKLGEGLVFMNNAIRYPLFLEQEMKNENPVVDGEFQRNESNPVFFLFDDLNRHMWKSNYYRKNAIGLHDVILTCTPEKMRIIQEKYYYPDNSLIAIAGDVKHDDVFAQVEKIYGDWKPGGFDPFQKWPIPEFEPLKGVENFVTINENAQIPMFITGYHGPDTRNDVKATYAADVFSYLLNLSDSKLRQELVETGLAYDVNVGYQTCKYTGPINIFLVPNPAKVSEAWKTLQENIGQWASPNYFTDEQLETAKNQLAIQDAYDKESISNYVHTVTYWWASASLDYNTNYIKNVQAVTREDIQRYVETYIIDKPHVNGLLLHPDMLQMVDVKALGFEVKQ